MSEDHSVIRYKFYQFIVFIAIFGLLSILFAAYIANSRSIIEGAITFILCLFVVFLISKCGLAGPFEKITVDSRGVNKKDRKNEIFLSWEEIEFVDVKYDWKNRWRDNHFVFALTISNPADKKIKIDFSWTVYKDLRAKLTKHCKRQDLIQKIEERLDEENINAVYKNRKMYKSQ